MKKLLLSVALLTGLSVGMRGQALHFDGVNDNVNGGSLLQSSVTNVTMEAWIYPEFTGGATQRIIYNGNSSLDGYGIYLSNGSLAVLFGGVAFNNAYYYPNPNEWIHVALVQEGIEWKFYVNGILQTDIFSSPVTPTGITTLGGDPFGEYFSGKMDEVRLWNVARTETEIQNNMNCSLSGAHTGLIANYNFNQGTPNGNNAGVSTLTDGSGNGSNMTLYNFALNGTTSNWVDDATIHNFSAGINIDPTVYSVPATGYPVTYITNVYYGGTTPAFQWYKNGVQIPGETGGSYTGIITPLDTIYCVLTSSNSCINNPVDTSNYIVLNAWAAHAALHFDGYNDYVAIENTTNMPVGNSNYTLEAWVKPENMGLAGIIGWGSYGDTNQVNALRLSNNGIVNYWWGNDLIVSTPDLSGAWHHIAATYDGTDRKIYLDGTLVGTDTPAPGSHNVPNASNLTIGLTFSGEYFPGIIDEVRIWNVARTQTEIQDNMNCQLPAQSGLLANYTFNQGIPNMYNEGVDSLLDVSGNNNAGALTNFGLTGGNYSNWTDDGNYNIASAVITSDVGPYISAGDTVVFTATAINGGSAPSYQWMVNGVNAGTNSNTLTTSTLANGDEVTCMITSNSPCVSGAHVSNVLVFTILPPNSVPYNDNCFTYGNVEYCSPLAEDNGQYYNDVTGLYGTDIDDADILSTGQGDAYDGAFEVVVADSAFTTVSAAYIDTLNNIIQSAKQSINGLKVDKEFKFFISKPIVRLRVKLYNPSNSAITTPVNIFSNLGSDSNTEADTSSNGTTILNDSTRWMVTTDGDSYGDPVLTWARFGKGDVASQPAFVNQPDDGNDDYEETFSLMIPPHSTKYIVIFNRLDSTTEAARLNAPFFDNLQQMISDSMFVGIDSLDNIVNWSFAKPVPAFTTVISGCDTLSALFTNTTAGTNTYNWNFGDGSPAATTVNPAHVYPAGIYTVALTATGENGFDSTIVQNITVAAPDFGTSLNGATITANNASAISYQWLNCDSAYAVIPGAIGQSYTATANGNYAVIITTNGCADTSACVAVNGVSLKTIEDKSVMVYPNPASDMLTIKLPAAQRSGTIEIVDVTGRIVYTSALSGNTASIRIVDLCAGVYQLRVNSNGSIHQTKFVKQ